MHGAGISGVLFNENCPKPFCDQTHSRMAWERIDGTAKTLCYTRYIFASSAMLGHCLREPKLMQFAHALFMKILPGRSVGEGKKSLITRPMPDLRMRRTAKALSNGISRAVRTQSDAWSLVVLLMLMIPSNDGVVALSFHVAYMYFGYLLDY